MPQAPPTASYDVEQILENTGRPIAANGPPVRQINSRRAARLLARYRAVANTLASHVTLASAFNTLRTRTPPLPSERR